MKLLLVLCMLGAGCTCLTQFDPESQPCEVNAPAGQQCLQGYECRAQPLDAGFCRRIPDAGP